MADTFAQAGKYFSGVFDAQGQAARQQVKRDRPGLENDMFSPPIETASTYGAVPPEVASSAPTGDDEGSFAPPLATEGVKEELIQIAKTKRNGSNGLAFIRAGGGINPAVKQVT